MRIVPGRSSTPPDTCASTKPSASRRPVASADALGAEILASACQQHGLPLVSFSSDLVFDGRLGRPYLESDPTCPAGTYRASKARAERGILASHPGALVIRTSAVFGPWDRHNFAFALLRELSAGGRAGGVAGRRLARPTCPISFMRLLICSSMERPASGISPTTASSAGRNSGPACRYWAGAARQDRISVKQSGTARNTALSSEKAWIMPTLESAIARFIRDCEPEWRAEPAMVAAE